MIDLMFLTHQNKGSGLRLDVMDFLWHELQWGLYHKKRPVFAPYIMHLICVCWSEEFGGDLLALPEIETVRHPVKALRIKQHEKPRDAVAAAAAAGGDARTGAEEGDDLDTGDDDSVPEKKKGWWGKLESKLKQVLCFQDSQKKIMYRQHVKEKEAQACQVWMMRHLGMTDISSGSNKDHHSRGEVGGGTLSEFSVDC
jgi:hypothetical protein